MAPHVRDGGGVFFRGASWRRAAILAQAEQIMLDDGHVVPLWVGVNLNLVSPRVTGWVDNAVDVHLARHNPARAIDRPHGAS